jgi:hypothetical protein
MTAMTQAILMWSANSTDDSTIGRGYWEAGVRESNVKCLITMFEGINCLHMIRSREVREGYLYLLRCIPAKIDSWVF